MRRGRKQDEGGARPRLAIATTAAALVGSMAARSSDRHAAADKQSRNNDQYLTFTLNGQVQRVQGLSGDMSLNTYIREHARLRGTKLMCREGGCGACVVCVQFVHPVTGVTRTLSVNSCMFPLYACHGYKVTTVEGIGSKKDGYHDIQSRLAHFSGTQCGYCSPGWVMAMYSLLESNSQVTMKEIEDSLSGNLCRCTGYRPILDAFKSFASDKSKDLCKKLVDIEDMRVCKKRIPCIDKCDVKYCEPVSNEYSSRLVNDKIEPELKTLKLDLPNGLRWYKVAHVDEIFEIFGMINGSYMLVCGNTAQGITKDKPHYDVFIDISDVAFLKSHSLLNGNLYIGANTTLSDAITLLLNVAEESPMCFSYTKKLAEHIEKVANPHVRNVGTIAGNLFIKHQHKDFQSDIFLILEAVGAYLSIRSVCEAVSVISLQEFLSTDLDKKVILQVVLPPLNSNCYMVNTFKIAPRAQNAIAYVNGGFRFKVDKSSKYKILERPRIVFGGISPNFVHATETEMLLSGKRLLEEGVLQAALQMLGREVTSDHQLPSASPLYRTSLAQALLYRVILSMCSEDLNAKYRSGENSISRPLSSGKQEFDTSFSRPPLYQPFPKIDALLQCSGEAEYVYDIPKSGNDLFGALVITKHGPATLAGLDPVEALKLPGVVFFFSAKDIPGENTFTPKHEFIPDTEELFASKNILYAGQPVGIIVAETQEIADLAAGFVKITYKDKRKPVLTVEEVLKTHDNSRVILRAERDAKETTKNVTQVVKGEFKMDSQYHFPLELLSCVAVPTEDGLDVFCTSQWPQMIQEAVALLLNIPENSINVQVRRLGGGFGQKLTRAALVGGACALAAYLLHRPVRIMCPLETVMEAIGKRWPCYFNYEAGVNSEGVIQYLKTNVYEDAGSSFNDFVVAFAVLAYTNVYDPSAWATKMYDVRTDKACTVWTRAPGTLEAITLAEHIMEHIAHEVKRDPLSVRMSNLDKNYPIEEMVNSLKDKSDYETRKAAAEVFNKENVWKKRGISLVPMRFPMDTLANYHAMISVYRNDGSVAITHGGVEIGQGINTKAAQVCASSLGIPLDLVSVKPTNNLTAPNNGLTGGSFASESVCYAVEECCKELNKRLDPIRKTCMEPTWTSVIQAAFSAHVDLNVSYMFSPATDIKSYKIFGAIVLEVEVDILTGEHKVLRVDLLEDAGQSLNPCVDIGQAEGAFIMGLGYFTSEEILHDPDSGRVLTNRTLKYKVPGAKDIPVDFRVYLLKNADNPLGVLRSKAVGEPPLCLSVAVLFAIRQALRSARLDWGLPDEWLKMDAPFTAEHIFLSSGIDVQKYLL